MQDREQDLAGFKVLSFKLLLIVRESFREEEEEMEIEPPILGEVFPLMLFSSFTSLTPLQDCSVPFSIN